MCYCQVTISVTNKGEKRDAWFVFKSDQPTISQQIGKMIADGGLLGTRFDTKQVDGSGARQVVDSYEAFIDRSIIVSVTELRFPLVDEQGRALA